MQNKGELARQKLVTEKCFKIIPLNPMPCIILALCACRPGGQKMV